MNTLNFFKVSKLFLYAALFSVIFVSTETLFPFIVTKYVFFRIAVGLALISFLLGWLFLKGEEGESFEREIRVRLKSPLVIAVSFFVLVFILAGLFGFNPGNSFWSNFERGEGGFQMLVLYLFFLLLVLLFKNKKDWRGIFIASIFSAIFMIAYGLLSALGVTGFIGTSLEYVGQRFQGSLGNAAYVGTYLLFSIFYVLYLLAFDDGKKRRGFSVLISWLLVLGFLTVIWLTQTRGPFLGLGTGIAAFIIWLIIKGKTKWKIAGLAVLLVGILLSGFLYMVRFSTVMQNLGLSRFFNITFNNLSTQSRLWSWQSAIEGFKERPLLGWGPENYGRVFDEYFDTRHFIPNEPSDTWYDRAHNVFFDYLVETGILGLLAYVGVFVVFYLGFFRYSKKLPVAGYKPLIGNGLIFAMPVAYLVQGMVIFDVLPIYINLFLFLAFANFKFQENAG